MKLPVFLILMAQLFLAGCGGVQDQAQDTHRSAHYRSSDRESEPIEKTPRIGMSTRQIREMYGEPNSINHSGRGEVWSYWFNSGHAFIPYNFGYRARTGTFIFDADGVLKDFNYNE